MHRHILSALPLACVLFFIACSGDPANEPNKDTDGIEVKASEPATMLSITGTWQGPCYGSGAVASPEGAGKEYSYTGTETLTIRADGTFLIVDERSCVNDDDADDAWVEWAGSRGTISVSEDVLTMAISARFYSESEPIQIDAASWMDIDEYVSTEYAALIDGKLCLGLARRQGSGIGLEGTWTQISSTTDGEEPSEWTKIVLVFSGDTCTYRSYADQDDSFDVEPVEMSGTFVINADKTIQINFTYALMRATPILSSDWLMLINGIGMYSRVS